MIYAAVSALGMLLLASAGTNNLPVASGRLVLASLLLVAIIVGFLCGSTIARRAVRNGENLVLFSCLAGSVAGGILGCAYALAVTAMYLSNYTSWPQDRFDQVLVLLAYPVFAALGSSLGALVGVAFGLFFGTILKLVNRLH